MHFNWLLFFTFIDCFCADFRDFFLFSHALITHRLVVSLNSLSTCGGFMRIFHVVFSSLNILSKKNIEINKAAKKQFREKFVVSASHDLDAIYHTYNSHAVDSWFFFQFLLQKRVKIYRERFITSKACNLSNIMITEMVEINHVLALLVGKKIFICISLFLFFMQFLINDFNFNRLTK